MIMLNRLLLVVLILTIFSLESILGLPILSLFLFFRFLDRFNRQDDSSFFLVCLSLGIGAVFLALFYQLSLSLALLFIFVYYLIRTRFGKQIFGQSQYQWQFLQVMLYIFLQLMIFSFSALQLNLFIIIQVLAVLIWLIVKSSTWRKL